MSDVLSRLNQVFRDVFDEEDLTITRDTTVADIEGWDSLMHVTLLVNVEMTFGVKLNSAEVSGFKNVGDLADSIQRHLDKK